MIALSEWDTQPSKEQNLTFYGTHNKYQIPGPVVSKHGNLGPVVRARGAGSPTDRRSLLNADLGLGREWTTSMA